MNQINAEQFDQSILKEILDKLMIDSLDDVKESEEDFIRFYNAYIEFKKTKYFDIREYLSEIGKVDLALLPNLSVAMGIGNNARFSIKWLLFPNGERYLQKHRLCDDPDFSEVYSRPNVKIQDEEYNYLFGCAIAEQMHVDCAEYFLGQKRYGNYILSPNFCREGEEQKSDEELFVIDGEKTVSEELAAIQKTLSLRKFPQTDIDRLKLDFIKQGFFHKFINSTDVGVNNLAVIYSGRNIRLAPVNDFDYSFGIETYAFSARKADNGEKDIASYMKQFKEYPGFRDFLESTISKLDLQAMYESIESRTGMEVDRNETKQWDAYIENKISEIIKVYNDMYFSKGEKADESYTMLD